MIQVIAKIDLVPSKKDAYFEYFAAFVSQVHAEKGCIEYTLLTDFQTNIERQEPLGENRVLILEKWESVEALERHLVAPHMLEYRKAVKPMIEKSSLLILEPVFG